MPPRLTRQRRWPENPRHEPEKPDSPAPISAPRVLAREDPQAAVVVQDALQDAGVVVRLGVGVQQVVRDGEEWVVALDGEGDPLVVDRVVIALGRTPNLDALDLQAAGVAASRQGVVVDGRLRTANPRVFAIGDVVGGAFTHVADAMARMAVQNALVAPTATWSSAAVPWATYTSPTLAHVGPSFVELDGRDDLEAIVIPWNELDRGRAEGHAPGFLKAWVDRRGRLVAATVVGDGADEMIATGALAIHQGLSAEALSGVVLPYPTRSEAWKRVGDAMRRRRLTPMVAGLLRRWIRWWGAGRG